MRRSMADEFPKRVDVLDAGTRKELSEIATALHMTLVWSVEEHKERPAEEEPPAA